MASDRSTGWVSGWLSGLVATVALTAAVSGAIAVLEPYLSPLSLLVLYLLAILPVAILWGTRLAVVAVVLSTVAFAYLFLEPQRSIRIGDWQDLIAMAVFLITAAVVGELTARMRRAALESARLSEEQSALRRVATLVAQAVEPVAVFEAVTREVGRLCAADLARMERYEDGAVVGVAAWSREPDGLAVGTRLALDGPSIAWAVREHARPARLDGIAQDPGMIAEEARAMGIRSSVGCPIVVGGRTWGVIAASSRSEQPFPADTEAQITRFTELVATAIANAEARAELRRLADEQAALRRVAILVARGVAPELVFAAVAKEVRELIRAEAAAILRFESGSAATVMSTDGNIAPELRVGAQCQMRAPSAVASVLHTGRPARLDEESHGSSAVRSCVATPIAVEGRRWGAIVVSSHRPLASDTEQRMTQFGDIVATALANAQSRAELAASRARVVAAADETRRRLERDLHDGAQQRLVSLALNLRLAQSAAPDTLPDLRAGIGKVAEELTDVLDELREISHGIHPAILSEGGLDPALRTLARRSPVPVVLDIRAKRRFPQAVEVGAYYMVCEALANTAKHACAADVDVVVEEQDDVLRVSVSDDGRGGADPSRGSGLLGLRDRAEALGGTIEVSSPVGAGTTVTVTLPLRTA